MSRVLQVFLLLPLVAGRFREKPHNTSVLKGEEVTLRCAADLPQNDYEIYTQWRTNTGDLLGYHEAGVLSGHGGRYSYVKESPEEIHLRINHVSLEDDGLFECQVLGLESGPSRASAHLNVLGNILERLPCSVPPTSLRFGNYRIGSELEINEESTLNITCIAPYSKPKPELKWYVNGRQIEENIQYWEETHLNKTVTAFAALHWTPSRNDNKKMLTCEAVHPETSTTLRQNVTLSVLYSSEKPQTSILNGERFVKSGANVTLSCSAVGGSPPPNVTWYLHGKAIDASFAYNVDTEETSNEYSFIAEPSDNNAAYECRVQNRKHVAPFKSVVPIRVAYAPSAVDVFGESNVRQGGSTTLQCRSRASNPPAKISWFINGHPVQTNLQSEHKQPHGTISISNLTINSYEVAQSKFTIAIECAARNDEGSASKQHFVKILVPPGIPKISGLDDTLLLEGDAVNVTCEVHGGHPLANIAWYRGHDKLPGARTSASGNSAISTLSLTLDRSLHKQRLRCEAMNAAIDEPLVDWKQLNIYFTPRRLTIRTPEGTRSNIIAGQEARLLCSAPASNPAADILWHFYPNGESQPLVYSGETVVNETLREHGHTIENIVSFIPTELFDGTIVRCIASNPLWPSAKNVTFPLNVQYAPRMLVGDRMSIIVNEGDSFRENITVKANPPVSSWKWRKNELTVGPGVLAGGPALSGRAVQSSDAGVYSLHAINNAGATNITIQLTVEFSAKIIKITTPVVASAGDETMLSCEADGMPTPKNMVTWHKNGIELPSIQTSATKAVLRVNVSLDSAGQYICRAFNGIGEASESTAFLLVNQRPSIMRLPAFSKAAGAFGGKARVKCRAHAVPDAEFYWEKNADLIRTNNSKFSMHTTKLDYATYESSLWVSIGSAADYGEIRCIASNRFGEDSHIIKIGPLTAPDPPGLPRLTNATSSSISVSWAPGFDGGADQTFEIAYRTLGKEDFTSVNTTHSNVRISGLDPAESYQFQVRAHNLRGFSSEYTSPATTFSTLTVDGREVGARQTMFEGQLPRSMIAALVALIVLCLLCNITVCIYRKNARRRKTILEKTEIIRTHGDNAVRPVQMYGAIGVDGASYGFEPPGSHRDEYTADRSEDDHSIRTMIEVSPNGYMQQIDPAFYEHSRILDYEFDAYQSPHQYKDFAKKGESYASAGYPEPPQPTAYRDSLTRRTNPRTNNNEPKISTFVQAKGVTAAPMHYSQLDGDLV